jgi:hypothetical protein
MTSLPVVRYGRTMKTRSSLVGVLHWRHFAALSLLLILLSLSQGGSASGLLTSAAIAAIAAIAIHYASVIFNPREIAIGSRAHAHREVLSEMPAPQHPATEGRAQARAPSLLALAA